MSKRTAPKIETRLVRVERYRPWERLMWGIYMTPGSRDLFGANSPKLLGEAWCSERVGKANPVEGEPTRALLFTNRREARKWCAKVNTRWDETRDSITQNWRVAPVRVHENVVVVMGKDGRSAR